MFLTWKRERLLCFEMFLLFAAVPAQSQVLEMTEFYADIFDYSASKYERKDGNGVTCALVRVLLPCNYKKSQE